MINRKDNRRRCFIALVLLLGLLTLSLFTPILSFAQEPSNSATGVSTAIPDIQEEPLAVKTLKPTDVYMDETTYATLRLDLTSLGNASVANIWFEYGPDGSFGSTVGLQSVDTPAIYIFILVGFHPEKTYSYRAVAETTNGIAYGESVTFTDDPTTEWAIMGLLPAIFATMFLVVFLGGLTVVSIQTNEWRIVIILGPIVAIIGFLIIKEMVDSAFGL